MTFAAICADIYRRCRYTKDPPADIQTRVKAFVNETHREVLSLPGIEQLRDDVVAVTATANYARSGLPPSVARVNAITDRTNNHKLAQVPLRELRMNDPAQAFTGGFPLRYAVVGPQQVQFQPTAATGLWAVSSSASDTTATVFAETFTTGGYRHLPAVLGTTITGTSRVALGSRTDSIEVLKFYLSQTCVGYISLYDAVTAGNELARIEPNATFARYLAVEWHPIQTATCTLYADVTRTVADLVNDTDEPLLPVDFHDVVGLGARLKEYEQTDDSRAVMTRADYLRRQAALKSFVLNDGDRLASLRRLPTPWSQLGGMFPSGS